MARLIVRRMVEETEEVTVESAAAAIAHADSGIQAEFLLACLLVVKEWPGNRRSQWKGIGEKLPETLRSPIASMLRELADGIDGGAKKSKKK